MSRVPIARGPVEALLAENAHANRATIVCGVVEAVAARALLDDDGSNTRLPYTRIRYRLETAVFWTARVCRRAVHVHHGFYFWTRPERHHNSRTSPQARRQHTHMLSRFHRQNGSDEHQPRPATMAVCAGGPSHVRATAACAGVCCEYTRAHHTQPAAIFHP